MEEKLESIPEAFKGQFGEGMTKVSVRRGTRGRWKGSICHHFKLFWDGGGGKEGQGRDGGGGGAQS